MAKIGRRRLAREVVRVLTEQPARRAELMQQLAGYLIDAKQTRQADLLIKDIADELYVQNGQLSADIDHAFELSDETRSAITALLIGATGAKNVELTARQVPELIGGVVVRTPRQELDASVRRQLKQIAGGIK